MKLFDATKKTLPNALPCLYCGVDSGPVLGFFLWVVGAGLLAFLSFLVWGALTGKFDNDERASRLSLDCESEESRGSSPRGE